MLSVAAWQAGTQVMPEQPSLAGQVLRMLPSQSISERRSLEQCGPEHITGVEPSPTRPPLLLPVPPLLPLLPSPPEPPSVGAAKPFLVELEPQPAAQIRAAKAAQAPVEKVVRRMGEILQA